MALIGAIMAGAPRAAEACAVCFGKTDSPLGKGMNWGIMALLGCILFVLSLVVGFALFLFRRSTDIAAEDSAMENTVGTVEEPS